MDLLYNIELYNIIHTYIYIYNYILNGFHLSSSCSVLSSYPIAGRFQNAVFFHQSDNQKIQKVQLALGPCENTLPGNLT